MDLTVYILLLIIKKIKVNVVFVLRSNLFCINTAKTLHYIVDI